MAVYANDLDSDGVPKFAKPWIQLGKLLEREKWQAIAMNNMESAIISELQELRKGFWDLTSRFPDLRQNISGRADLSQAKIASLIMVHKKMLSTAETGRGTTQAEVGESEKKVRIQASQHQQFPSCEGSIPDATAFMTDCMEHAEGGSA